MIRSSSSSRPANSLFQPSDMVLDPLAHRLEVSSLQPVLLGSEYLDDLAPPGREAGEFLALSIRQRIGCGLHRLSKVS